MKSYVSWNLTWHEILRDVKSCVTWNLMWHEILRDMKSCVIWNLAWHEILRCVTSYVLHQAAGVSDPTRIREWTLDAAYIRTAARIRDEPLDQIEHTIKYGKFIIWLPAARSLHAKFSMHYVTRNLTWHAISRDMQSYLTCNLTWHAILRDNFKQLHSISAARHSFSVYTLSLHGACPESLCR